MTVAVVRYNAGNILSVINAVKRLGVEPVLTDDPATLRAADRVIFPGQGEARSAMRYLRERGLDDVIRSLTQPVLGICIGLHLMCRHSEENDTPCLDLFDARVRKFPPKEKVPHVGWNTITDASGPLFEGLPPEPYVYFLHSYYAERGPYTTAVTDYVLPFSAALHRDNFHAVQFHPEKSGPVGETILRNFLNLPA
jgi:glutamine amidotransferase